MRSIVCLFAGTGYPGLLVGQNIATGHANFTAAIASWSQEASNAWQYGWKYYSQTFGSYFQVGLGYPAFVSVSVSLRLCLSLSVCLCLSVSVCLSLSVCLSEKGPSPISMFTSLCDRDPLPPPFLCLCDTTFVPVYVSVSETVPPSPPPPTPPPVPLSLPSTKNVCL